MQHKDNILSTWKWHILPMDVLYYYTHLHRHLGLAYFYLENNRNKSKLELAANSRVKRRETQKHSVRITIHQSSLLFTLFEFVCRHRLSNCLRKNMWFELLPTIWLYIILLLIYLYSRNISITSLINILKLILSKVKRNNFQFFLLFSKYFLET